MNRREMIAGLGAVVAGGAAAGAVSASPKFTKHIQSTSSDMGSSDTRVWLDGREVTDVCFSVDTELGRVELLIRDPVYHRAIHYGAVLVEVGGKVYPS